jgi:hypothetical protein
MRIGKTYYEIVSVPDDGPERAAAVSHARDALRKTLAMQGQVSRLAHSLELNVSRYILHANSGLLFIPGV